jgi:Fe-S cluster biosynthesis and repair protein YggX
LLKPATGSRTGTFLEYVLPSNLKSALAMTEDNSGWTKEAYKAYLFIFCMKADFHVEEEEVEFIKSKVGEEIYEAVFKEIRADNDYHRTQKILSGFEELMFSDEERHILLDELEMLFKSDGHYDILEKSNFLTLKRLLSD